MKLRHPATQLGMFLGLMISLAAPLAATAGDLGPEVEQIVGDLLALPGWEIRGTYLAELTQTAEPDLADRRCCTAPSEAGSGH